MSYTEEADVTGPYGPHDRAEADGPGVRAEGGDAPKSDGAGFPHRSRRALIGVVVGAVVFSGAGVAAGMWIRSPAQRAADALPPAPSVLTRAVEKRVLTSDVVTRGEVAAAQTLVVAPQVDTGAEGSRPVVSRLPKKAGSAIRSGEVLAEISGRPVFALEGAVPVYRDLKPGARGQDVRQLQEALGKLGFGSGQDARGRFGTGTEKALTDFYASIGYEAPSATGDDGAAVKAATVTLTAAERAVEDARTALADASYALGRIPASEDRTQAKSTVTTARRALDRSVEDRRTARADLDSAQAVDGPELPASEVVFLSGFPARVDTVDAAPGSVVGESVLTVSAGDLVVRSRVNGLQVDLLKAGQSARVYAELGQRTVAARIVSVAEEPSAPPESEEGEQTGNEGYLVVLRPDKELGADLSGQDVRVTIQAASTGNEELVVPVTAVSAGRSGVLHVTVVDADRTQRNVEIRELATGDGYVAVEPLTAGALSERDLVVTGVSAGAPPAAGSDTGDGRATSS